MRKLLSILFFGGMSAMASAQCTPMGYDFGAAPYGIYPDTSVGLNTGILNVPFEQVMYIKVPIQASEIPAEFIPSTIDPALLALATIDYIKIDSINVMINGVQSPMSALMGPEYSLYCSATNCEFAGGDQNCVTVAGTPLMIGDYDLVILASGQATATVFGFPVQQPVPQFPINGYSLHISLDAGVSIEAPAQFEVGFATPNPAKNIVQLPYAMAAKGNARIMVTGLLGNTLVDKMVDSKKGDNVYSVDVANWEEGVYLYSIDNGKSKVTRRLVVQH
jgi:hypothetical protein